MRTLFIVLFLIAAACYFDARSVFAKEQCPRLRIFYITATTASLLLLGGHCLALTLGG